MAKTVIGFDPGDVTGYGIIEVDGEHVRVVDYGTIPQRIPGLAGLLQSVWMWLESQSDDWPMDAEVVFEDYVPSMKLRTTKESVEVRGIIRLWLKLSSFVHASYQPATIRSQIGVSDKKAVRKFCALAVGLAHALKMNYWSPRLDMSNTALKMNTKRKSIEAVDTTNLTPAQIQQGLNKGTIRPKGAR